MELLKNLLKNPKVIGMLLAALVAGIGLTLGVNSKEIKESYCGAPAAAAAPALVPHPAAEPAK